MVFSQFLGMLDLLQRALRDRRLAHIRIDGSTAKRQALIDQFTYGDAQVALCSLRATSHGINLAAANHVVHADRWWNPAIEDQATDRVHRIGQFRTVLVHRFIVADTLEERIDALLSAKRVMADSIMNAAAGASRRFTREELIEMLTPPGQ